MMVDLSKVSGFEIRFRRGLPLRCMELLDHGYISADAAGCRDGLFKVTFANHAMSSLLRSAKSLNFLLLTGLIWFC